MATRHVLADLTAAAAEAGLPALEVESIGGVDAAERVAAGEAVDLVFLAVDALRRLAEDGHVDAATVTPLVLSQVAVAVPETPGSPEPPASRVPELSSWVPELVEGPPPVAFADAAELRRALRAAHRIGYSTGPSGTALVRMIDGWGLTPELGDRLVQARPGIPVAASLAAGEVDLGFQQLSELTGRPGVRILGVMPADCAIDTVFAGAVATASADRDGAARVLAFLASDAVGPIKLRHAFGAPAI
jgi:molybdate transport system substrate-binding protein